MKIAVCLKQVPDMESKFIIIDEQKIDESQVAFMINDFDKYAVETALQLKEQFNGEITIITIGPDRAAKDIRHALAMGADKGIHINDESLYNKDNLITATALAKAIEDVGDIDIILTVAQAEDNQAAQTGIMISDILKIASCSNIVKLSVSDDSKTAKQLL